MRDRLWVGVMCEKLIHSIHFKEVMEWEESCKFAKPRNGSHSRTERRVTRKLTYRIRGSEIVYQLSDRERDT
jgi:hypothetical protein